MKNQELVGIFADEREAVKVINGLKAMGYSDDQISVIAKRSCSLEGIVDTDVELNSIGVDDEGSPDTLDREIPVAPVAAAGNPAGLTGNPDQALAGYGLLAVPGAESFSARGPVAGTFGTMDINDPLNRIARALVDIGVDKDDADKYKSYIDRCDVIVAVEEKPGVGKKQVLRHYKDNNSLV